MDFDRHNRRRHWQELAAEASTENDAGKLMELIEELCEALDWNQKQRPPVAPPPTEDRV